MVRSADSAMRRWSVVDGLLRNNARGDARSFLSSYLLITYLNYFALNNVGSRAELVLSAYVYKIGKKTEPREREREENAFPSQADEKQFHPRSPSAYADTPSTVRLFEVEGKPKFSAYVAPC